MTSEIDKSVEAKIEETSSSSSSLKRKEAAWFEIDESQNTYVYVEGLPNSISEEEFIDLMKKYGIIKKKAIMGNPLNVKLYKNSDGSPKGDGLVCYEKIESVELAIELLDGYQYDDKHTLKCSRGTFQQKGTYDPTKKPRVDPKAKLKHKKTVDKLLSWEPKREVERRKVILKHMFTPQEILDDAELLLDLKDDVESKCSELKLVPERVDIYDKHEEGVIAVSFADGAQATRFMETLDNQFYAGRVVKAELWDGKTKYKTKETDDETEQRVDNWHKHIAGEGEEEEEEDYRNDLPAM